MKTKHILLFFISIFFAATFSITAQEESLTTNDTVLKINKYGLRIGADLSKPIRSLLESDYKGFEIIGDFRISKRFYIAAEIGN